MTDHATRSERAVVRPRLADVAAQAGVSMKTVSNVVNHYPYVTEQTRAKVLAAIDELGYVPDRGARNLARGRTGVIVLGVPQLDMPYFASLAMHLITVAEQAEWWVQIRQTRGERAAELELLAGTGSATGSRTGRIDGVVLSAVGLTQDDLDRRPAELPLVLLGEQRLTGVDHVGIDNVAAARAAVAHLVASGARRVAVVGGAAGSDPRVTGARQALRAAGLDLDPRLHLVVGGVTGSHGERAMGELLDGGGAVPDAVFCVTDWLAMGVIRALQLRGHRVPADVAVMGFDDIPYDLAALPTLSTIAPDRAQIARLAVAALGRRQSDPTAAYRQQVADHRLVVRESTAG